MLGIRAPLNPLDLFGDGFVRDPYPWLDRLRAEAPVRYGPGTGLWLVSRYDDVRRVLLDPTLFRPDNALHAVTLCRSKIRFSSVSCGDAVRSGSVTVFVYQTVEDRLSLDSMGLEVGNSGRDGRFGAVWR